VLKYYINVSDALQISHRRMCQEFLTKYACVFFTYCVCVCPPEDGVVLTTKRIGSLIKFLTLYSNTVYELLVTGG
jgi:hypothetical protein